MPPIRSRASLIIKVAQSPHATIIVFVFVIVFVIVVAVAVVVVVVVVVVVTPFESGALQPRQRLGGAPRLRRRSSLPAAAPRGVVGLGDNRGERERESEHDTHIRMYVCAHIYVCLYLYICT